MRRSPMMAVLLALTMVSRPLAAQGTRAMEEAVKALNAEWGRAWAAKDIDRYMAVFDHSSPGLFILGGNSLTLDSLRSRVAGIMQQRSNEQWTDDLVIVTPMNDSTAFLQTSGHGRFTLANGQTWEYSGSGTTALVKRRGAGWKIVAFQNAIGGGRRVTPQADPARRLW